MEEDLSSMSLMGAALRKLLRPVVRLLLKHSFPYAAFEAVAKRVYVETVMEEFALPGKKPSVSRAAILTGLTRKDVNFLLSEPWPTGDGNQGQYRNRAARVLSAWVREPAYKLPDGAPRDLPVDGADGFAELVRQFSGDIPTRAILDELVRVGSVQWTETGLLRLVQRAFVPSESVAHILNIFGTDVRELMETIIYNVERGAGEPRYQRKVMHIGIPTGVLPEFRALSAKKSQALLEEFDSWLSAQDDLSGRPDDASSPQGRGAKVGVGIYYYEEVDANDRGPQ